MAIRQGARIAVLSLVAGCARAPVTDGRGPEPGVDEGRPAMIVMTVRSPAFEAGGQVHRRHTGEGDDVSPALLWSGAPEGTKEFAVMVEDPDAPSPKRPAAEPWVHWVLYGIPADARGLEEGSTGVGVAGANSWPARSDERLRYAGPMPPPGSGRHRYFFRVYALDAELGLAPGVTKKDLVAAMKGHVLAEGELVGTYERK